jgi:hypothetical protein
MEVSGRLGICEDIPEFHAEVAEFGALVGSY